MISIIHPSRSRPEKSVNRIETWIERIGSSEPFELIISLDEDDPSLELYKQEYSDHIVLINKNKSSVEAINKAAEVAKGDILIVVSDDTDCKIDWDVNLLVQIKGKTDWILKTQDGIQPYIITMPVMDRVYYNRTKYIYHPDFLHMFCDTYMSCVADINGRRLTTYLDFPHDNPGHYKKPIDDINRKNDATWIQGEQTFIRLMKQFSREDIQKIKDRQMIRWLRNKGVQV